MPGRYIATGLYSEVVVYRGSTVALLGLLASISGCLKNRTIYRIARNFRGA